MTIDTEILQEVADMCLDDDFDVILEDVLVSIDELKYYNLDITAENIVDLINSRKHS